MPPIIRRMKPAELERIGKIDRSERMSCGFEPLTTPDAELFALEPEDIHLDMRL